MDYMFIGTRLGNAVALTPRQYRRAWALGDLQVADSRLGLAEKYTGYHQYRAKRLASRVPNAETDYEVAICPSSQRDMDRLDDSSFARLDGAILALAKHPAPRGRKRIKWLNPDLWCVREAVFIIAYTVEAGPKRLRIIRVGFYGKRVSKPRERAVKREAAPKRRALSGVQKSKPARSPADGPSSPIDLDWQDGYCGQTVDELLSLEGRGEPDLVVRAFSQAIQEKVARRGRLSEAERVVLAVHRLDATMVTDGIDNFFIYCSDLAPTIVESLLCIGCKRLAKIAQRGLDALKLKTAGAKQIAAEMAKRNERREEELSKCSAAYWKVPGPARQLFAFIKAHRQSITF